MRKVALRGATTSRAAHRGAIDSQAVRRNQAATRSQAVTGSQAATRSQEMVVHQAVIRSRAPTAKSQEAGTERTEVVEKIDPRGERRAVAGRNSRRTCSALSVRQSAT